MGLLGKSFRGFVGTQVKKRQEALGEHTSRFSSGNKTKAFLTSTPWIRLASSVNLGGEGEDGVFDQMKKSDLFSNMESFKNDELAKNFVLFGGVNNDKGDKPYSGINKPPNPNPIAGGKSPQMFGGAYGFGSWGQLFSSNGEGYKPMPGITNMDFSYRNDGALSQATVSVKAFSRAQFQIIDVLFQRPGYTVLLEYGHSVFLDGKGEMQYAGKDIYSYQTLPFQELFNKNTSKDINHYSLSSTIYQEKEKWHGNYEGAFMKITKYSWKYNIDGSYDITVNLVGCGDIISSLKANVIPLNLLDLGENEEELKEELKEAKESGNFLLGNSQSTSLNKELYEIYSKITKKKEYKLEDSIPETIYFNIKNFFKNNITEEVSVGSGVINDFPSPIYKKIDDQELIDGFEDKKKLIIKNGVFLIKNPDKESTGEYNDLCYITFGYLISLITKHINLKNNKEVPYIFFDLNYQEELILEKLQTGLSKDSTYLATYPGNMSSDPSKIIIPFKKFPYDIWTQIPTKAFDSYVEIIDTKNSILSNLNKHNSEFFVEGNKNLGRLDRVYLDINYIAKTMDENTIEGECKLIDLINQILRDINENLGGINEFRVLFNQEKQLISFVSEIPTNTDDSINNELFTINSSGMEKRKDNYEGSFVKGIDLKAELSDAFATQVSIGAQSDSNRLQGNGGAFSSYNKGLEDRIMGNKNDSQVKNVTSKINPPKIKSELEAALNKDFIEALKEIYLNFNIESSYIDIVKQYNSTLSPLIIGELETTNDYLTPFFLPFNLGLTLYGLGGIRIYDGFKLDGKILPPSYDPSKISLIIKSLSHNVNLEGWTTKIETLPKPIPTLNSSTSKNTKSTNSAKRLFQKARVIPAEELLLLGKPNTSA